jgi:hypothetical protein
MTAMEGGNVNNAGAFFDPDKSLDKKKGLRRGLFIQQKYCCAYLLLNKNLRRSR